MKGISKMVKIYTLPACVQCDSTKRLLTKNEIPYEEVDLSKDPEALAKVREMGYTAAPVVVAGEDHWSGFRPDKLSNLAN